MQYWGMTLKFHLHLKRLALIASVTVQDSVHFKSEDQEYESGLLRHKVLHYLNMYMKTEQACLFQQGEGVPSSRKGVCANHVRDVEKFFRVSGSKTILTCICSFETNFADKQFSLQSLLCNKNSKVSGKINVFTLFNEVMFFFLFLLFTFFFLLGSPCNHQCEIFR